MIDWFDELHLVPELYFVQRKWIQRTYPWYIYIYNDIQFYRIFLLGFVWPWCLYTSFLCLTCEKISRRSLTIAPVFLKKISPRMQVSSEHIWTYNHLKFIFSKDLRFFCILQHLTTLGFFYFTNPPGNHLTTIIKLFQLPVLKLLGCLPRSIVQTHWLVSRKASLDLPASLWPGGKKREALFHHDNQTRSAVCGTHRWKALQFGLGWFSWGSFNSTEMRWKSWKPPFL